MSFTPSRSVEDVVRAIRADGVCYWKDSVKGLLADEFTKGSVSFTSSGALDFCKKNTFDDSLIVGVLETFFDLSILGMVTKLTPFPGQALAYFGQEPMIPGMVVQLMSRGSQVLVFKGSHKMLLRPRDTAYLNLLHIPYEQIEDCHPAVVDMEGGGLLLMDARLAFTVEKGFVIHFVFGVPAAAEGWAKMRMESAPTVVREIEAMDARSAKIKTNFSLQ
ncbi:MAG: hypothetical protein M1814_005327 [Vezdaea aestivalis]|nr:MAG: hypothetical protein M1814_005327 [Vezdaea aestivalis]